MPRAKSICSVETDGTKCLRTKPCPVHSRKPWQASFRNVNRPSNWRKVRNLALRRDGFACVKCGSSGPLEVDHIRPVAQGGSWELSNLQTLCSECHRLKTIEDNKRK